ncbi:MAG TPA: threonine dehydratase [Bryobacteraceae bacterium]|nr:threonine dehydratase [Bryobacteraceae bacterium]
MIELSGASLATSLLPSLAEIEAAAEIVYRTIAPTPQINWPLLSARTGAEVWVKHENHSPLGAFKVRGGLVYMESLRRREPALRGVIAATRGNHGQSVAFAAKGVGLRSVIVVPHGNSTEKNAAMRALGADLIEFGNDFQEAYEYAAALADKEQLHFVRSFDSVLISGVASYALELFRAVTDLDAVYVPIGLGSGICGCIAVRDALGLKTEIIGVVAANAPTYLLSLAAGSVVPAPVQPTIADGMACRTADPMAVQIIAAGASRIVIVEEADIREGMRCLFSDTHNTAEGAGAAALAGLFKDAGQMHGERVAVVLSGGNVDSQTFGEVLLEK